MNEQRNKNLKPYVKGQSGNPGGRPKGIYKRQKRSREIRKLYAENAKRAIKGLSHNCEIFGLTKGQFSLIHLVVACLDITGPAAITISTWTAAQKEIDDAAKLVNEGRITSLRLLVDVSFTSRQPAYCRKMRRRFGDDAIRVTKNHAKFVMVRNDEWNIVLRSSMNLNKNSRLEFFEVGDDLKLANFLDSVVAELFQVQKPTLGFERRPYDSEKEFREQLQPGSEVILDWDDIGLESVKW